MKTLPDRLSRLELLCALIRAVYASRTDEQFLAAMKALREAREKK